MVVIIARAAGGLAREDLARKDLARKDLARKDLARRARSAAIAAPVRPPLATLLGRHCFAPARKFASDLCFGFGRRQPGLSGLDGGADADFQILRHQRPEPVETRAAIDDAGARPQALLAAAGFPEHQPGAHASARLFPFFVLRAEEIGAEVFFRFSSCRHRFSFWRVSAHSFPRKREPSSFLLWVPAFARDERNLNVIRA